MDDNLLAPREGQADAVAILRQRPQDATLQDIMLAIQTGSVLSDPNRMRMSDSSTLSV